MSSDPRVNLEKTRAVIRRVLEVVHTGPYDGKTHQTLQDCLAIGTAYEKPCYDSKGNLLKEFADHSAAKA